MLREATRTHKRRKQGVTAKASLLAAAAARTTRCGQRRYLLSTAAHDGAALYHDLS